MNMRVTLKLILIFLVLNSCYSGNHKSETAKNNSTATAVVERPDYDTFKSTVKEYKSSLNGHSHKEISDYLFTLLNDDIYFYWKGTPWDFNGYTQKPNEGSIACGYFVTNTLSDLGFKIQRVKLAQVVSSQMINTLCGDVRRFAQFDKLQKYLSEQPDQSVYIIGLDYHTGYILKDSADFYFLHSNYINAEGVVKEKIESSRALLYNRTFMIGSLSSNEKLLKDWVDE
jgi:hypothetical protein